MASTSVPGGRGPGDSPHGPGAESRRCATRDIVVESDIIIDFLNGVEGARAVLERQSEEGVLRVSAVSAARVMADAAGGAREATEGFLRSFGVLPVDGEVALVAGRYFDGRGRDELELDDCIVAATCDRLGALLLTAGLRRYPGGGFETRVVGYDRGAGRGS